MFYLLKKYGTFQAAFILTMFVIVCVSLFTYLFLYLYQGFVDLPGYLIPILGPILFVFLPSKLLFDALLRADRAERELRGRNEELEKALAEITELREMLPICSVCKKIRDDKGYWNQIEDYLHQKGDLTFSHGICPDCASKLYPEYISKKKS